MKICILSDAAAPHTVRWARWFARRGHEVHVISLNDEVLPGYENVRVHTLWRPVLGNVLPIRILKVLIVMLRMKGLLRRIQPDVIHAHSAGGYSWMAFLSGFRPYLVTPWGTDLTVDIKRSKINAWLTGVALRGAAMVTTDGLHFVEIIKGLGVPESKIALHFFGVDVDFFCPGADDGERRALALSGEPVVISTRTLHPIHDVDTFIKAIPLIRKKSPLAKFVVVGDGADRGRLEALAKSLGVDSVTKFVGMVNEERMRRLLRMSNVYVSTSITDAGLAGSTGEAMAVQLPVVHTDNSDNGYWASNGEGGFLFQNGDYVELAESVCRILVSVEMQNEMGTRNRQKIVDLYNTNKELAKIQSIYQRVTVEHQR